MSESAPDAAQQGEAAARDERDQQVVRRVLQLGAAGLGRAEIAAALGMCPDALDERETEDAALAAALRGAAGLAQAWWERVAREAYAAGRFNFVAAGTREMRRRFGERGAGDGACGEGGAASVAAAEPEPAPVWRPEGYRRTPRPGQGAVYEIPCNGRTKRRPDGTCPCGSCEDERRWAAEEAAYYAAYPDQRPAPRPARKAKTPRSKTTA